MDRTVQLQAERPSAAQVLPLPDNGGRGLESDIGDGVNYVGQKKSASGFDSAVEGCRAQARFGAGQPLRAKQGIVLVEDRALLKASVKFVRSGGPEGAVA